MTRARTIGFTLLEVMVAVAILAIALTAFFASQTQAIRAAGRARMTSVATLLARCKMAEIDEQMARDGLPAVSATGTDECCEDAEMEGFACDWKVERIVLPEPGETGGDDGEEGAGAGGGADAIAGMLGGDGTTAGAVQSLVAGGADSDALGSIALEYAYPILKPSIEEQVRRATVTVRWKEGSSERQLEVGRYLVAEQPPPSTGSP